MATVIALLALVCVSYLVFSTLASLYPGAGSIRPFGPSERTVQVRAESCHRVGPISENGLGNWWVCRARLQADSERTEVLVTRSIIKPADIGTVIELRQACSGSAALDCSYGKPTGIGWQLYYGSFYIIYRLLVIVLVFCAFIFLARAVLGVPRYFAIRDRMPGS
ncbi:DUF6346 domain-containing protein [Plantactinospora sp. KLBMP9567]|uniref:DUF6346 domain-containing protein n=1 Tax=Plantactinospora sp. KLBMP9567 TaxID=3085900 RepID=UPI0039904F93